MQKAFSALEDYTLESLKSMRSEAVGMSPFG